MISKPLNRHIARRLNSAFADVFVDGRRMRARVNALTFLARARQIKPMVFVQKIQVLVGTGMPLCEIRKRARSPWAKLKLTPMQVAAVHEAVSAYKGIISAQAWSVAFPVYMKSGFRKNAKPVAKVIRLRPRKAMKAKRAA